MHSLLGSNGFGGSSWNTSVPPLCISSTSRFVLAMDVMNRNKLYGDGLSLFSLKMGFSCVQLDMSSITLPMASDMLETFCKKCLNN